MSINHRHIYSVQCDVCGTRLYIEDGNWFSEDGETEFTIYDDEKEAFFSAAKQDWLRDKDANDWCADCVIKAENERPEVKECGACGDWYLCPAHMPNNNGAYSPPVVFEEFREMMRGER